MSPRTVAKLGALRQCFTSYGKPKRRFADADAARAFLARAKAPAGSGVYECDDGHWHIHGPKVAK